MPLLKKEAPDLNNVNEWINSAPINMEDGKYLLYFWNYSCGCCRERLDLFRHIHQKYSEIKVVGIHTPEFSFEEDEENLRSAVEKLDIDHPVAHDSIGRIFEDYNMAYSNHALVIDGGSIVFQHTRRMEDAELLQRFSEILGDRKTDISKISRKRTSQEFFGYSRTSGLNEEGNYPGEKNYQLPENRKKKETYLKETWDQTKHYIEAKDRSELRCHVDSSEAGIIVDPNDGIKDISVLINGESVTEEEAGEDLRVEDGESYIRVKNPDLYSLVDSDRQKYEITLIPDKRTRLYALSFR